MQHNPIYRAAAGCARACVALAVCALAFAGAAWAQSGEPIKIGFSMALTGGLAPNGKSALLAQKIWEEDINAKGGLLGRPVKLIYYDDKSSPAEVPSIYTKLLDIDKVDLIIGPYATAMIAPAMPMRAPDILSAVRSAASASPPAATVCSACDRKIAGIIL